MDPISHTLVGASLAATGLARRCRVGPATIVIGANLPDIDALTYALGADASLFLRRGWTHGILAMLVLPLLLAGTASFFERRKPPASGGGRPRAFLPLLLVAVIAVWSHPALDLLNTYGIRLLMPFDGRWFYGDTLFIVDPWFWLLAGAGALVTFRRGRLLNVGWVVLGVMGTALVFLAPATSRTTLALWLAALLAVAAGSSRPWAQRHGSIAAASSLVALLIYVAAMRLGSVAAREYARTWLEARQVAPVSVMAGPVPVDAWRRDVIVELPDRYEFLVVELPGGAVGRGGPPLPRGDTRPAVQAALAAPGVRGFREWKRYPSYTIAAEPGGVRVLMRDVRYAREGERGFAIGQVFIPNR